MNDTTKKYRQQFKDILMNQLSEPEKEGWYYEKYGDEWAVVHYDGGVIHRYDGPAVITRSFRVYFFWKGKVHRISGPAIILPDGEQHYYQNDVLHRIDGPALVKPHGKSEWWVCGVRCNPHNFNKAKERYLSNKNVIGRT